MTSKTVKLMMAISLSTGLGMSTLSESAEAARITSNEYSGTSQDQTSLTNQFSLVNATRDGNPIVDQNPENNISIFSNAIEDYTCGSGQLQINSGRVVRDSSNNPIFVTRFTPEDSIYSSGEKCTNFAVGNLEAQLIESDSTFANRRTIEYRIINPEATEPERSYILELDFSNPTSSLGFFRGILFPSDFNLDQAVNSLTYILENNLLGFTEPSNGGLTEIILRNKIEKEIPDPSPTASLLALGALGAGSLLKRKMKPN
jgi:hypothetical protein